jgi:hypothetical protein
VGEVGLIVRAGCHAVTAACAQRSSGASSC